MNLKRLLGISVILNLIFVPVGTVYLIRKAEFLRAQYVKSHRTLAEVLPVKVENFVSTLDYQWQEQLFEAEPVQNGAIVFLGDSITWEGHWQQVWRGKTGQNILNRGITGDTMDGVIARVDEVMRHHPHKIFIMIGINDLRFQQKNSRELMIQYEILLRKIVEKSQDTDVYLQSLLPVRGEMNRAITEVNQALSELADGRRVHYVDIHSLMTDSKGELREDLTFDGVHIRAIGYKMWQECVWSLVN